MRGRERRIVRNPVLALPSMGRMLALPPEVRLLLAALLADLALDARLRAETCWRRHKAPMAAYWKAVSVYAGHIRRALLSDPALVLPRSGSAEPMDRPRRRAA